MKNGFTLIEIIVTLVIVAIVGGIGIANLNTVREKAGDRALEARLTQLEIARKHFIKEWGRLEAERIWASPPADSNVTSPSAEQNRYALLKRYIERPQNSLAQVAPQGYSIAIPANINGAFIGTRRSDSTTFTSADNY